jgi:murein DD-endopeptidase MepM/ murein hydrolase activator NlpD
MTAGYEASLNLRYEAALAALTASPEPDLTAFTELEKIALQYATTSEGQQRLASDIRAAETSHQYDLAALLSTAVTRGQERRNAARELTLQLAASRTPHINRHPQATERRVLEGLRDWQPDDPIWPNAATTSEAIALTRADQANPAHILLVQRAYRYLFRLAWASHFSDEHGNTRYPREEREGWQWRAESIEAANTQIMGATPTPLAAMADGTVVFTSGPNGNIIQLVTTHPAGSVTATAADGTTRTRTVLSAAWVTLGGITHTENIPADELWLALPRITFPEA